MSTAHAKLSELERQLNLLRGKQWFKAAEAKAGHVSVCLVGYEQPLPRSFSDNKGARPCTVAMTSDRPRLLQQDKFRHWHGSPSVLAEVRVIDSRHGAELRATLMERLLGSSDALDHGWRDIDEPDIVWPILLADAMRELNYTDGRHVISELEHIKRVLVIANKRAW